VWLQNVRMSIGPVTVWRSVHPAAMSDMVVVNWALEPAGRLGHLFFLFVSPFCACEEK
jgi:hypothetical protein